MIELADRQQSPAPIEEEAVVQHVGLDGAAVRRAIRALEHDDPPFFTGVERALSGDGWILAPTGHARRTVGQWPTPENLADKIVAGLREAAEQEDDPEAKGWLKKTANWFGGAGRDVIVGVATSAVTRGAGM